MAKYEYDPAKESVAAGVHYAQVPRPPTARDELEAQESADEVQRDLMAEKLRAAGCPARDALRYVAAVVAVIQAKDKACAEEMAGAVEKGGAEQMGWMRGEDGPRRLMQALSQVWDWPDSRKGLGALFFAMGAPLFGCNSMRELARLRGVSVEDVSNNVEVLQEILGAPRNALQKSAAAVASYKRECGASRRKE